MAVSLSDFKKARRTIPEEAFEDYNWVQRIAQYDDFLEKGPFIAAEMRRNGCPEWARDEAPQFFDFLLSSFPAEGDAEAIRKWMEIP